MKLANSSFERVAEVIRDTRSSAKWVQCMNAHGFRDDMIGPNGALPALDNSGLNTSKKQYLKDRMLKMNGEERLHELLLDIINTSPDVIEPLNSILREDSYSITSEDGNYQIDGVIVERKPEIEVSPSFDNSQKMILDALDSAKISIRAALAWFTNQTLADKLVEKYHEGVEVAVAIFIHPANINYKVDLQDVPVKWIRGTHGGIMHHKICVIDNQTVITGSYNWTTAAETKNDENANVISGDNALATEYSLEFRRVTGGFR